MFVNPCPMAFSSSVFDVGRRADDPNLQYDITYYKRDTRRAAPREIYTYIAPSLRQLADERTKVGLKQKISTLSPLKGTV